VFQLFSMSAVSPKPAALTVLGISANDITDKKSMPIAGLWTRLWEETPLGDVEHVDRTTFVWWLQSRTSGLYVDVRLPLDSPGRSPTAAAACGFHPRPFALAARGWSDEAAHAILSHLHATSTSIQDGTTTTAATDNPVWQALVQQKSFAGMVQYEAGDTTPTQQAMQMDSILARLAQSALTPTVSSSSPLTVCTCTWHRTIDYQPPTGGLDWVVCAVEALPDDHNGSVRMRETGHTASYAEGWYRLPHTHASPCMAAELVTEDGQPRPGVWVRVGAYFAYAIGRPTTLAVAQALHCPCNCDQMAQCVGQLLHHAIDSWSKGNNRHGLDLMATYVAVAGQVEDNGVWNILHSTQPELVGCRLIGNKGEDSLVCSTLQLRDDDTMEQAIHGPQGEVVTRVWKIREMTDCDVSFLQ
jgi:hypothetical protein